MAETLTLEPSRPEPRRKEAPAGERMTYEEFLAWCDEDTWAEWVDGEVIVFSPAHRQHQAVSDFLGSVFRIYVETRDLGVVISAPFQMKMERGREPDLLFVAREHLERLQETYLEGPADLVVEIVSPESRLRDRGEKFAEYEMEGVREYWVIDPEQERVDFHVLDDEGYYRRGPGKSEGIYHSEALSGFWLKVEWLWDPPPVLEVLRELEIL